MSRGGLGGSCLTTVVNSGTLTRGKYFGPFTMVTEPRLYWLQLIPINVKGESDLHRDTGLGTPHCEPLTLGFTSLDPGDRQIPAAYAALGVINSRESTDGRTLSLTDEIDRSRRIRRTGVINSTDSTH